jgi:hypothetical protein
MFTDNEVDEIPPNVRIINTSFNDFSRIIQKKFDFKIPLSFPYKLCDFKPAYGYIFQEYIETYSFWGYCDLDLIWGNIIHFFDDGVLDKYDRLFSLGHFSLFRNKDTINRWFMDLFPGYKDILSNNQYCGFDEYGIKSNQCIGMGFLLKNANKKHYMCTCYDDIRHTYKNFFSFKKIDGYENLSDKEISRLPSFYEYNNGTLLRHILINGQINTSETMYVHFQKREFFVKTDNTNQYFIIPNEFISITSDLASVFDRCKYTFRYPYYLRYRFRKIKKRIFHYIKRLNH